MQMTGLFLYNSRRYRGRNCQRLPQKIERICQQKVRICLTGTYRRCLFAHGAGVGNAGLKHRLRRLGRFGHTLTTCVDKAFFGLRIKPLGFVGIATMISGIVLLKMV